jgi:aryl carrier-like protein
VETREGFEQSIVRYLQMKLPDYMIPWPIVQLDSFPLTSNGKVDRRALPMPDDARLTRTEIVAPRSQLEERLAALWRDVLGLARVGVYDNFFDLGGHSLLLMRLHERIRESFDRDVSIIDLFARPTINDLAAFLASGGDESDLSDADARARKQREILKRKKQAAARAKSKPRGSA